MILEKIKTATAANHHRMENSALMLPLTKQTLTTSHYCEALSKLHGYFAPLEDMLNHINGIVLHLPDFAQRRKAFLLLEDLKFFGINREIPICTALPALTSLSQAFGCLYVLEGSSLGGQYISRLVKKNLNLAEGEGTTFFEGYKKETGIKWKMFQQALISYSTDLPTSEETVIIESANETFVRLEDWLNTADVKQPLY